MHQFMRDMDRRGKSIVLQASADAAAWFVILRDCNPDRNQRRRFVRWLKASPLHVAEFWRIQIMYRELRAAKIAHRLPPQNSAAPHDSIMPARFH